MTKKLIWLRYISWVVIGTIFIWIFINGSFHPTRAQLLLQSEGELAYKSILWDNMGDIICCAILLTIGIVLTLIVSRMKKWLSHHVIQSLQSLSQFVFCSYLWVLTDSYLLSYVTSNNNLVALLSYVTFTVMFAYLFEFIMCISKDNKALLYICYCLYALEVINIFDYLHEFIHKQYLVIPVYILFGLASLVILIQTFTLMKKEKLEIGKYIINGYVCIAICGIATLITYLNDINIDYTVFYSLGIILMCVFLTLGTIDRLSNIIHEQTEQETYKKLAYTDEMTGLKNKTAYIELEKQPLKDNSIIIMLDLNDLKNINDTYGHRMGDEVIIVASRTIKKFFPQECCYRFGGDEFVILLNDVSYESVLNRIDEMKEYMDRHNRDTEIKIEFSIGYSKQLPGDTIQTLFLRADQAMYKEKFNNPNSRLAKEGNKSLKEDGYDQLSIWDTQEFQIPELK